MLVLAVWAYIVFRNRFLYGFMFVYSGFEVTCPDWDLKSALDHVATVCICIRECGSTLYVGMVQRVSFLCI